MQDESRFHSGMVYLVKSEGSADGFDFLLLAEVRQEAVQAALASARKRHVPLNTKRPTILPAAGQQQKSHASRSAHKNGDGKSFALVFFYRACADVAGN